MNNLMNPLIALLRVLTTELHVMDMYVYVRAYSMKYVPVNYIDHTATSKSLTSKEKEKIGMVDEL